MNTVWPAWQDVARFSSEGPAVTVLHESGDLKVVLVALGQGQGLPVHPGPAACFHILDGTGVVIVDGEQVSVRPGYTVIAPPGAQRGVRAETPLVFLGNLGDPASEPAHA